MNKLLALFFIITQVGASEVHCRTNAGHVLEFVIKKTPYDIVSINKEIKRTVHIQDINNLSESTDYFIEKILKSEKIYKLKCTRIIN